MNLQVDAKETFAKHSDELMARAEDLDGGPMAAALPKLARITLRLALIHHAALTASAGEDPGRHSITMKSVVPAIEMARWFTREAERVYAMFTESPEDRSARRLAELIQRKGGRMTARELCRTDCRRFPNTEAAQAALDDLAANGFGQWGNRSPRDGAARHGYSLCA